MATNFLSISEPAQIAKNSDTMSEISESGTTTSGWASRWDSREDLRDLVTKLGLNDISELYQERFRVDRFKLEKMLIGDNDAFVPADVFFAKIMEDLDTIITWPNKLKIGAKSKKDPHVRIAGRPQDVQSAKDRILAVLNTRSNRVTMKMDVSYTDHSHIIGKGGLTIKRVMEETKCHVHFPDSNRSNSSEKSNQVSISGDINCVELARARVRELIPLIFGFELPIMSNNVDANSPYIIKIQEQYKVQVMFKTRPKLHATLVLVKGVEWEVWQVKQATHLLMEYICDNLANEISVQMSMEISPHHHSIVMGKNHVNLKAIMQYTKCQIMVPDAQDPNIPNLKKSNVIITGNIHNVYKARQLLMGSLPLSIIFDLPDDADENNVKLEKIGKIQNMCDVSINIRQKANKTTRACVIKGIERHASNIYKARNLILGIEEPSITAVIPLSYHRLTNNNTFSPIQINEPQSSTSVNPPPLSSPLVSTTWYYPSPNTNLTQQQTCPSFVGLSQQHQFFPQNFNFPGAQHLQSTSGHHQIQVKTSQLEQTRTPDKGNINSYSSSLSSPNNRTAQKHNSVSPNCNESYGDSPNHSPYKRCSENQPREFSAVLSEMNTPGEFHGPTFQKTPTFSPGSMCAYEIESKRLNALRAIRMKPHAGNLRVPHNSWSGYGVSYTSPGGFFTDKPSGLVDNGDVFKSNSPSRQGEVSNTVTTANASANMNTSDLLDQTPSYLWNRVSSNRTWEDLASMLTVMKLDHYIPLFKQHEIDLTVFGTLTDQDLIEIGITAFGARRRILLAISELNMRNAPFSVAPGAERTSGSTPSKSPVW
ncbi:hypothetical protein ABEB36_008272 [Hypothenemus hampei]|uniref:SAM domain-containing protein n=1 Tax=Hypothenemus hampei TaxID=57062 RepID=A0ABD1EP84_HYPHA